MATKFELVNQDFIARANEIIPTLTREQKAYLKVEAKKVQLIEDKIDEALLKEGAGKIEWIDSQGNRHAVTIIKTLGSTTTKQVEEIDWTKVEKYAKEHNIEIPMTKPEIDKNATQNEMWFQEHIDDFKIIKEVSHVTKPTNKILVKN